MTTRTDWSTCVSEEKFSSMEAFAEAVHDVFLELIFLDDLLVAVAFTAGPYLIPAADGRLAILCLRDIMRGAMAVHAESAIRLFFLYDIFSMHTGEDLLICLFMTLCAGCTGNGV